MWVALYQHTLFQVQGSFNWILIFNTSCVCVRGVCQTRSSCYVQSDTISGASPTGWERVADSVVRVSASSPSVLGAVCFYLLQPLSAYRAVCSLCLYICLLSGCLPIGALVRLSVCRPHLLVCSAAFQPVCLGLLLAGDKQASWQPEAICHFGLFCSAPVSCLLLVCPSLVCPMGPIC